ncbi:hypothetical protein BDA96_08G183600 [Sorghum bicolor]|uniref:Uncharacterized protein n=1 Tax=Sorghum bicolor TaxID=4558 RepID=A0A921QHI8_SORBI|nr:hypothetical protein BDA96_08G183600 [Sorghum bicolor]
MCSSLPASIPILIRLEHFQQTTYHRLPILYLGSVGKKLCSNSLPITLPKFLLPLPRSVGPTKVPTYFSLRLSSPTNHPTNTCPIGAAPLTQSGG